MLKTNTKEKIKVKLAIPRHISAHKEALKKKYPMELLDAVLTHVGIVDHGVFGPGLMVAHVAQA